MILGRNQQAFVDALKSGRFTQGQYRLRGNKCFCAQGVAAHITGCDWARGKNIWGDLSWGLIDSDGSFRAAQLPDVYIALYALKHYGQPISSRNDSGMSFVAIAAEIEADPAKFFTESR